MPSRIIPFITGQTYHIYNRGTEKRPIFKTDSDRKRFLKALQYYQLDGPKPKFSTYLKSNLFKPETNKHIVKIHSYCLMPNHFHILVTQEKDGGITEFISKLTNSYTKYFNTKYNRVGPLLQGEFKAVLVESDEQLIHLSRYIHLNPIASFLTRDLDQYKWSSFLEYTSDKDGLCNKEEVLNLFKSPQEYHQFVLDRVDYAQTLESIKHQTLED